MTLVSEGATDKSAALQEHEDEEAMWLLLINHAIPREAAEFMPEDTQSESGLEARYG